jgi:hypothetical protein
MTVPKYLNAAELDCRELPGSKPCYCMSCSNRTSYGFLGLWHLLGKYYDSNLQGGNCSIRACNETDFETIVSSDNTTQMRVFGLGAGQSFVSTGRANLYCNYTLQLATKWMKGSENSPPRVPEVSRSACWLQRSILPLYIYYTEGKAIDPARTQDIASAFEAADSGPVFITTEVWLNSSDDNAVSGVKQQLYNIRHFCTDCMAVLAVKQNDYNALYKVIGPPGAEDPEVLSDIDAIGFGFRANDYSHCSSDRILHDNLNFSSYILTNYSKPSIWLYVGASEGNSSNGECQWDSVMVSNFYQELLTITGGMASSGVLGMGFYEFVDGSGSLPCNGVQGCDFGLVNAKGEQKHPQMNAWADMCQEIGTVGGYRVPLIFSRNSKGAVCDKMRNPEPSLHAAARIGSEQGFSSTEAVPKAGGEKGMGCGEACPSDKPMPPVYDSTGHGSGIGHCGIYPIIDERADDADLSASYMRAEFEQESLFDPWKVSCNAAPCGTPLGTTMEDICVAAGYPPDCQANTLYGKTCPSDKPYFCAFGLAQCIEYPGQLDEFTKGCGGEKYNPFDPGMSACCGVNKFSYYLRDAPDATEKWVKYYWNELSPPNCYGAMQDGEQGWAAYYLASNRYFGTTWNRLTDFKNQRPCTGGTGSYNHYIDYLRNNVTASAPPGTSYGAQVMSRFGAAVSACGSDCPG